MNMRRFFKIRKEYSGSLHFSDMASALRCIVHPDKTILFYPQHPHHRSLTYKLCALLEYAMTSNIRRKYDVAFKRQDSVFFDSAVLKNIDLSEDKIINAGSHDISKKNVGRIFREVFGYALEVDPTQYQGPAVQKSNNNGVHDGTIVRCPLPSESIRPDCVYQKAIDNSTDKGMVLDYRVPVHGDQIPLIYLKYRPIDTRFSNENSHVEMNEPESVFSASELKALLTFSRSMGIDYGEFDALRDRDGRIYVVDANTTPWGPPNGLPESLKREVLERMATSFKTMIERYAEDVSCVPQAKENA